MMRLFECKVRATSLNRGGEDEFTVMVSAENAKSAKKNGEPSILQRMGCYDWLEFTDVREIKIPFSIILPRNVGYAKEYSDWVHKRGGFLALDSQSPIETTSKEG